MIRIKVIVQILLSCCIVGSAGRSLRGQSSILLEGAGEAMRSSARPVDGTAASKIGITAYSVVVLATPGGPGTQPDDAIVRASTSEEIRSAAGAYSDIPRFLQTMPGVMFSTDARNTYLVNGGNPLENLFVVNGFEIPNINHISTANSSGGFVSMIDTDAVSSIKLHKMLYGSEYSGALSSVLEIKTRETDRMGLHGDVSLGYAGAGLVLERSFGQRASMMTEVRKSIVNYFTDDIGFDGVPKYASVLSTSVLAPTANDSISTLYLQGSDELAIHPNLLDPDDPGLIDTFYAGDRVTVAGTWEHRLNESARQLLQLNFSHVRTTTLQTDPRVANATVYNDNLLDAPAILRYDFIGEGQHTGFRVGLDTRLHTLHYQIQQPNGYPSPYSTDPTPVDATNINRGLHPFDVGAYAELTLRGIRGSQLSGGARTQRWAVNGDTAFSPRLSLLSPSVWSTSMFGGVARYSQLAPLPLILGIASNQSLRPISDTQMQVGVVHASKNDDRLSLAVYRKLYRDYPVSTEFPSLSQADIVDIFAQPSFPMPMVSQGRGTVAGAEAEFASSIDRAAFIQVNLTLQTVRHRALDGISRPASFDTPVMGNVLSGVRLRRHQILTARYSYHTGTPYTPLLLALSLQQERPIYDLTGIDSMRGSSYGRLDLRYEIERRIGQRDFKIYLGLENALDRKNYYQYVFLPNCRGSLQTCAPYELSQVGRLGDGGVTYRF